MMSRSIRVRYLKAVEGVAEPGDILGGTRRNAKPMQRMWDDIGGTDDAIALYIKRNPRLHYNPATTAGRHEHRPEHVAALLWLPAPPEKATVYDFTEDAQYEIGCPVAAVNATCGPHLRDLVFRLFGADADGVWRQLRGSLTGGRPFRIDDGAYAPLGDALTSFYAALPVNP